MRTVSISELKKLLSAYLSRVKAGEDILVTDRGRIVAKITSVDRSGTRKLSQHLLDLEKMGKARIGSGRLPNRFWEWRRPADPVAKGRKALLLDREHGR